MSKTIDPQILNVNPTREAEIKGCSKELQTYIRGLERNNQALLQFTDPEGKQELLSLLGEAVICYAMVHMEEQPRPAGRYKANTEALRHFYEAFGELVAGQ